jgi:hypothetical protein
MVEGACTADALKRPQLPGKSDKYRDPGNSCTLIDGAKNLKSLTQTFNDKGPARR